MIKYSFKENKWTSVKPTGVSPIGRSSHSAIIYEGGMYVWGGKDEDNNKLNDFWRLDLIAY